MLKVAVLSVDEDVRIDQRRLDEIVAELGRRAAHELIGAALEQLAIGLRETLHAAAADDCARVAAHADRLSRLARVTAASFPGLERSLPGRRVAFTGLPDGDIGGVRLIPDANELILGVPVRKASGEFPDIVQVSGEDAREIAALLMPRVNRNGAGASRVREAVTAQCRKYPVYG